MASAIQKITFSSSRDIPFNRLVLSQSNVRRLKAGQSIDELAADIARRGLLQSLNVRPVLDADGAETGTFEVPAGGRRFRALELLVKQKKLNKTAPIPCVVREAGSPILAEDDSLAENVQRVSLHPLDQFRAFRTLLEKGLSEEEIAAAFFVPVTVVRQRLRLMTVSEKLLAVYGEDGMRLDQVIAFSISDDPARQEQIWEILSGSHNREPYLIRRMLTEKTVRASDVRVRFVGLDAYVAAGGHVMRDLFEADDGGWLNDPALLDRLVMDRLETATAEIRAEGWKWVETALSFPWGHTRTFNAIEGRPVAITEDELARLEALRVEQEAIEADYAQADELPDAVDARLGEIEQAIEALETRPVTYDPAEMARAGAFVSLDNDGTLLVARGFVRPEDIPTDPDDDEASADVGAGETDDDADSEASGAGAVSSQVVTEEDEPEDEDGLKPLPDRLVTELTAWRTLALRDAFASNPHVALTEFLHTLCLVLFHDMYDGACLQVSVRAVSFPVQGPDLAGSIPAHQVQARDEAWKADLPTGKDVLWIWLDRLDNDSRLALLAHCLSQGVNALYEKVHPYGAVSPQTIERRIARADRLAMALRFDPVEAGWTPTIDNYLGRVTKARILQAVREARGEQAAQMIAHLKKPDMAREAERLLEGSGWLPEALRAGVPAPVDPVADEHASAPASDSPSAIAAE
ncbi:ParB N-terminal domain-containing protein [Gluconacetobacter azotocaptans]|uniref:ParB N-terminal domain-containing protein n=1 Tax=Gluconacetobacter azotocaptans TaxID=142834 RepID=A0A7W4JW24_9PROT|nr:ParB/RepB/Spo0J family partition protein [Gluconacetobacter azotocaptans]MBB2191959.1 ParB N-terminal domain-containing protein [Gluconacetobacter azotocaptans]MBM9401089.1 ParB N-terminal domain-containing protein [Gluconacetobacter azotocaptans]GBQ30281.1 ParB-like domain-containing protein [Gluconacetobacter azotocaptans DSM 13594]